METVHYANGAMASRGVCGQVLGTAVNSWPGVTCRGCLIIRPRTIVHLVLHDRAVTLCEKGIDLDTTWVGDKRSTSCETCLKALPPVDVTDQPWLARALLETWLDA